MLPFARVFRKCTGSKRANHPDVICMWRGSIKHGLVWQQEKAGVDMAGYLHTLRNIHSLINAIK